MLQRGPPRDTSKTVTEDSPLYEIESVYQSRYYSLKYWMSRLILDPENETALLRYSARLAEVEELLELRRIARKKQETLIVSPPPRPPPEPKPPKTPRTPKAPRPPKASKAAPPPSWVPPPLSWD
jgi:hypothetical protein